MRKQSMLAILCYLLLAALLSACGTGTNAQSGQLGELPTAPPAPTYPPVQEPNIPPAPNTNAPQAGQPVLASDSFDKDLSAWTTFDPGLIGSDGSSWAVTAGRLDQLSGPNGAPAQYPTALVTGDSAWSDYTVQAASYSRGNTMMGLVGRFSDDGYYALAVRKANGGGADVTLQRYDNATEQFTELASSRLDDWSENTWYTLQLSFAGTAITGSINGQTAISASDKTYTQGQAGVYAYAEGELSFDNFVVQQ